MARTTAGWTSALVTGASSGIGLEIARVLAEAGTGLVLVARSEGALETLAKELERDHGVDTEVLVADLSDRAQAERVAERIGDTAQPIDLVVNNAGFGIHGKFGEAEWEVEERMLALNIDALTRLCHAAVRAMKPRQRGGILNVASMAAFLPSYSYATYGAAKTYVLAFTEVLREELRGTGVHATCLAPGFTRTGFQSVSGNEAEGVPGFLWETARQVAEVGVAAVGANRAIALTPKYRAAVALARLTPRGLARRVSGPVAERI